MFIWEHLTLPLLAIITLGVVDHHAKKGLSEWLVNLGWDSCVLALGAAPAAFLSESANHLCGSQTIAICWGFAFVLGSITIAGVLVGKLRSLEANNIGHAIVALMVGGALLSSLVFVASRPSAQEQPKEQPKTATYISLLDLE